MVSLDFLETPVFPVHKGSRDLRGRKERQVMLALQDRLEQLDLVEIGVTLDYKVLLEIPDNPAIKVFLDKLDHRVPLEVKD